MDTSDIGTSNLFQQLDNYSWNTDEEFQIGLASILGQNPSEEQAEDLTLKAKCFYYARKYNVAISPDEYMSWLAQRTPPASLKGHQPSTAAENPIPSDLSAISADTSKQVSPSSTTLHTGQPPAPYPTPFSQIVDLITNGQPIPGVKDVPDTLLAGQESKPKSVKRKKPWEGKSVGNVEKGIGSIDISTGPG